jgi:predicted transcriptional regulator
LLQVKHIMDMPFPVVDVMDPVDIAQPLLDFHSAVLAAEKGRIKGIITKVDLLGVK